MSKLLLITVLLLTSCASISGEWGNWKRAGVAQEKMEWKFCRADLHGQEFHHKGICYMAQQCRYRTTILRNTKSECRNKLIFCGWGDVQCLNDNDIFNNIIINKGARL